jgi:hypothetical protein
LREPGELEEQRMDQFEFVLVLVSIIIGLALTELLSVLARILRKELDGGLLHSLWMLHVGVMLVQQFWSRWVVASKPDWSFTDLAVFLLPALLAFLAASLLSPSGDGEITVIDQSFVERRRSFFAVMILLMGTYSLEDRVLHGGHALWVDGTRLAIALLFLWAAVSAKRRVQLTVAVVTTVVMCVFAFGWTRSLSFLSTIG